jgi:hypothetical protein
MNELTNVFVNITADQQISIEITPWNTKIKTNNNNCNIENPNNKKKIIIYVKSNNGLYPIQTNPGRSLDFGNVRVKQENDGNSSPVIEQIDDHEIIVPDHCPLPNKHQTNEGSNSNNPKEIQIYERKNKIQRYN